MFKIPFVALVSALVAVSSTAQTPPPGSASQSESAIVEIENKVELLPSGTQSWLQAQTNQTLRAKDRLRTHFKSRATLRLSNQGILRVSQLTTLEIQPPADPSKPQSVLDLKSGNAYFFNRDQPVETQFRTPQASGAIRGTEFNIEVAEDGRTVVTLLDGAVDLSNEHGQVSLTSGEQGIVDPGQAPRKTAVIDAINIIQWSLYYPGILDIAELGLAGSNEAALAPSLAAYQQGDLLQAVALYPTNRAAASPREAVYSAALSLAVGQVKDAEAELAKIGNDASSARFADALRELVAAVKFQTRDHTNAPATATEWMARSYYEQSRSRLEEARAAARRATEQAPHFGFAWARLAEMEFSFGRTEEALKALEKGLELSARNAQAVSLKGFLLAAQNKIAEAITFFDQAIGIDGALGNAWLGRGLCRIRRGEARAGREDLQVAATLEPHRAVLRSYLAKAYNNEGDLTRAGKELKLAQRYDPNDPTAWLYSALLLHDENRSNEAIRDLQKSQDLNNNRSVFRSRLLLDQDRAVRSANLARMYQDVGMTNVSVLEASRAVNSDYANYSAHLFLANSYDALRDPRQVTLRYETPWLTELLLANLLAPVGAGTLSQNVSQQEYSKLFEKDSLGALSITEYLSRGDWLQVGSQYGTFGNSSYAIDANYRSQNGERPNEDLEALALSAQFKQQLSPKDSVFVQAVYYDFEAGDVAQYYDPSIASTTQRIKERQEPNLFVGYHHEWNPGIHTLLVAAKLDDTLLRADSANPVRFLTKSGAGAVTGVRDRTYDLEYRSELEGYSVEAQQIFQQPTRTFIFGGRFQAGWSETDATLVGPASQPVLAPQQNVETELNRVSVYGYHHWQIFEPLRLTAGVSYDRLYYPENIDIVPITDAQADFDRVSPKVGLLLRPYEDLNVRAFYAQSLGGVFFDTSIRIEPVQIAGFIQTFRSLIPESLRGLIAGSKFETYGVGFDHQFATDTYVTVQGEVLSSSAERNFGVYDSFFLRPPVASGTPEHLEFEEKNLVVTVDQLLSKEWALGAYYRLSRATLEDRFSQIPERIAFSNQEVSADLHQLSLHASYNLPCGFFGLAQALWSVQDNFDDASALDDEDFWQLNVYAGYRFPRRRAEIRLGVLNINDQDYNLNPLNLHAELPHSRTFAARFKFNF